MVLREDPNAKTCASAFSAISIVLAPVLQSWLTLLHHFLIQTSKQYGMIESTHELYYTILTYEAVVYIDRRITGFRIGESRCRSNA